MAFVILLYILISWLANKDIKGLHSNVKLAKFKILGRVPRGFQHAGVPKMDTKVLSAIASDLPVTTIVLILEHIAISKSFGRINNYVINRKSHVSALGRIWGESNSAPQHRKNLSLSALQMCLDHF